MKRFFVMATAILLAFSMFGCGSEPSVSSDDGKIKIVTTIFPEYDWVMNVLGDNPSDIEVSMLLDNKVDLHSFEPTSSDILKVADCDLFIYVGGESDDWVDDVIKTSTNDDMLTLDLMDVLGDSVKEEEVIEGMQEEEEESEEEGPEYDEHVWLSLRNASVLTEEISNAIISIDPENADIYKDNANAFIEKLNALDLKYASAIDKASYDTLLFGDRFPFRYLVDDYGLNYYAAFVGCSAESEASFETISFLSKKLDELSLPAIMTIEGANHQIAQTIVQNTENKDQKILTLDSMQSTTLYDVRNGVSYYSIMENNLAILKEALNGEVTADLASEISSDNETTSAEVVEQNTSVDVDLTTLSSTMVYAEVYNMLSCPDDYIGKTIKMSGAFSDYFDESTGNRYFNCIVADATACCSQGIEFELSNAYKYPYDYPVNGAEVCVTGTFDTYKEGDYFYCTLRNASLL